jgi:3-oxoacyl-[acyl-carrier protein] reductase
MDDLKGKKGIITAASSGIGQAVAKVLHDAGVELLISSSNREKIKVSAENIATGGDARIIWQKCDLTSKSDLHSIRQTVQKQFETLDYIIVNYGDPKISEFQKLTEEDWSTYMNMFIGSTTTLVRELLPLLQKPGGRIIFITSMTTRESYEGFSLSGSLRAAVVNLGKILSLELGPVGINVNSISQGYFLTDRLKAVLETNSTKNGTDIDTELQKIKEQIPLRRIGEPEEIGRLVAFLCSSASSYITGANIPIDGGITRYPY